MFGRIYAFAIAALVTVLGARVTSWQRDEAENLAVGGSPDSLHLRGWALDVGLDAGRAALAVLDRAGNLRRHDKGTGPHYHWNIPRFLQG